MFQWISSLFVFYNGCIKPSNKTYHITEARNTFQWLVGNVAYNIHYEQYNSHLQTTPLVLIHGFGTSSFHWRDNIPALSKTNPVYTMDLLGFGASDNPLDVNYTLELWRDQTVAYVKKIYHNNGCKPVILVGNSIGGHTAIYAAVNPEIREMVNAVILLNPVGIFKGKELPFSSSWIKWTLQPTVFHWLFHYFQSQIRDTMVILYPYHPERVDDALVSSILSPTEHPNARQIFSKILYTLLTGPHPYMEDILGQMSKPLYLLIGKADPWLLPSLYNDFLTNCPTAFGKWLEAGHCPHDEIPDEVNHLILSFMTLIGEPSDSYIQGNSVH